ncbi:TPA: tyrosine-type recombinase/integrase [Legionella pneumophila subsp. pneumophila]|jgi:site-specific recombinase XerD|uniref:Putative integrase/recombinase n=2 Tax=Legionella TaxID=445 RepID=A0A098G5L2_9GAMM|nr:MULTISPECIES: site-specific integrase [Legionella]HAT9067923.1 tyrosine-type recombinase/integrase [Legionella pneumophila subsp. pneumophila]EHL30490.1 putative integrase/recombinase [Legionella drancourtii LLAP12]CEG57788.1 putative integrase/recombinase [Legionella fallonii LLAP-10]CZG67168.1 Tyrosine recombinase XerD [Legionella pneumophila]STY25155.1 site-specific recombinase XerD [Legionella taurinensis]
MKPTDFSIYLSRFLSNYLAGQRNLSPNTIKAYRDVFILLLRFCRDVKNIPIEKLQLEQVDVVLIEAFLDHIEKDRHCTPRTLNHRLTTLHAFFRYIQVEDPLYLLQCQRILAIPLRRFVRPEVSYLSKDHLAALLAQPNLGKPEGRRDVVLLSTLYDTGARVQELIDLTVGDVRLKTPAQVRILGKGRKIRVVPLMDNTANLLQSYLHENNLLLPETFDYPLFRNNQGNKLTRVGVNYILQKYERLVREASPQYKQRISPHTLRHTKGMHLLQGGVSLDIIRDFLGHVDIKTTEIYARANLEMKRAAIEKVSTAPIPKIPSWKENKSLLQWLQSL